MNGLHPFKTGGRRRKQKNARPFKTHKEKKNTPLASNYKTPKPLDVNHCTGDRREERPPCSGLGLINEALYARIHARTDWLELHLNLLSLSFVPFLPCSHMIIIHATCIPKFSVDTQLSSQRSARENGLLCHCLHSPSRVSPPPHRLPGPWSGLEVYV